MKRNIMLFLAALLILAAAPVAVIAAFQTVETPITIPVSGVDFSLVEAALGAFGIGLVYIVNWIKAKLAWQDKKALIIVVAASFISAAAALIVKGAFTPKLLLVYGLAVLGEMTGWFKFTKKATV